MYVTVKGFTDKPIGNIIERRCPRCRTWYRRRGQFSNEGCPNCGEPPARFNKQLRTAALNNNLYKQAERARKGL